MSSISRVIDGIGMAVNLLCDVSMLDESWEKLVQARNRREWTLLETARVVNSLVLFGFSMAQIGGIFTGTKSETLQKLKSLELLPRKINIPLQFASEFKDMARNPITLRACIRLVEKGIINPSADVRRTEIAREAYYEQRFLDMTPAQLKKSKRPIYEVVKEGNVSSLRLVGSKPVDLEECRANLAALHFKFAEATAVRFGARAGVGERLVCDDPTLQRLAAYCGIFIPLHGRQVGAAAGPGEAVAPAGAMGPAVAGGPGEAVAPAGAMGPAVAGGPGEAVAPAGAMGPAVAGGPGGAGALLGEQQELNLNLRAYPNIPELLHEDRVFSKYPCVISLAPIRFIVRDPTAHGQDPVYYERSAIEACLRRNPSSPWTGAPLAVEDLEEEPMIQAEIDNRLQQWENWLKDLVQRYSQAPEVPLQVPVAPIQE